MNKKFYVNMVLLNLAVEEAAKRAAVQEVQRQFAEQHKFTVCLAANLDIRIFGKERLVWQKLEIDIPGFEIECVPDSEKPLNHVQS